MPKLGVVTGQRCPVWTEQTWETRVLQKVGRKRVKSLFYWKFLKSIHNLEKNVLTHLFIIHLKGRDRQMDIQIFHLSVHLQNFPSRSGWARLEPDARNSVPVSPASSRDPHILSQQLLSPGVYISRKLGWRVEAALNLVIITWNVRNSIQPVTQLSMSTVQELFENPS